MQYGGLSLRGLPLELIHKLGLSDVESDWYAAAQAAFEAAKTGSTPLLSAPVKTDTTGFSPYLRDMIVALLLEKVGGEAVDLSTTDNMNIYAELRLMLIEFLGMRTSGIVERASSVSFATPSPASSFSDFSAILSPRERPSWLEDAILSSTLRRQIAEESVEEHQVSAATDPALYVAEESAYWRQVSPFGDDEVQKTKSLASALAGAVGGERLYFEKTVPRKERRWEPQVSELVTQSLLNKLTDSEYETGPAPNDGTALAAMILEKYTRPAAEEGPGAVRILSPDNVAELLPTINVMHSYVVKNM